MNLKTKDLKLGQLEPYSSQIQNLQIERVYGVSILKSLLEKSSSTVGKAFGAGIEVSFLLARCYEPVGTIDLNDLPYCETSTHFEETN